MNELKHYGVKGMKWGVRRYQNADGSLTDAGKKRFATSIKKQYPRDNTNAAYVKAIQDVRDELADNYKPQIQTRIADIRRKKKIYDKVSDTTSAYYRSKDFKNDRERAYKETLDWFEKNEPDYLKTIIKNNDGDKRTLLGFHDFEKIYDGRRDKIETEGLKRFYKKNGLDLKTAETAWGDYVESCRTLADDILGRYGNIKVADMRAKDIVDVAVRKLAEDDRV